MNSNSIGFNISEGKAQGVVLEIKLAPQQSILGDAQAMLYLDEEIALDIISENESDTAPEEPINEPTPPPQIFEDPEVSEIEEEEYEPEPPANKPLLVKFFRAVSKTFFTKESEEEQPPPPPKPEPKFEPPPMFEAQEEDEEPPPPPYFYLTQCTNQSEYIRTVAFALPRYGKIFQVDLTKTPEHTLLIQKRSLLCGEKGISLELFLDTKIKFLHNTEQTLCFEKVEGEGLIFLQAGGEVVAKKLQEDAIRVNAFAIIAYETGLNIAFQKPKVLPSLYQEHQIFLVTVIGTGKIWLQSHQTAQTAQALKQLLPNSSPNIQGTVQPEPMDIPQEALWEEEPETPLSEKFPEEEETETPLFDNREAPEETPFEDDLDLDALMQQIEEEDD